MAHCIKLQALLSSLASPSYWQYKNIIFNLHFLCQNILHWLNQFIYIIYHILHILFTTIIIIIYNYNDDKQCKSLHTTTETT